MSKRNSPNNPASSSSGARRQLGPSDGDITTLPYSDRQLVVVDSDDAVRMAREELMGDSLNDDDLMKRWGTTPPATPAAFVAEAAIHAAAQLWKMRRRAVSTGLPVLLISTSQAAELAFPVGHPLRNVIYVADPVDQGSYYPIHDFHRIVAEGKVAEALRLLRSLGATEISIESSEESSDERAFEAGASAPVGHPDGSAKATRTKKSSSERKTTMRLTPTVPARIPDDLVWYWSEPRWQEMALARMESGLQSFLISAEYTDDFGINANLKAKIAKVGLEFGGSFHEFRRHSYTITGTFGAMLPSPDASA